MERYKNVVIFLKNIFQQEITYQYSICLDVMVDCLHFTFIGGPTYPLPVCNNNIRGK